MSNKNHLTLAVAGSGKTQSIVDACASCGPKEKILVLTYTAANQQVLRDRLAAEAGDRHSIEVRGWFSFLIGHFVRPYLPFAYPDQRVQGFDFKSDPQQRVANDQWRKYFNKQNEVRRVHLAQIAHRVNLAAAGAPVRRLERVYDRIFIDEVQDLCGWDLELLSLLLASDIPLQMVGDVRQAILVTNARERKNSQYMYLKVWDWFKAKERSGQLVISQDQESHRCGREITEFADSLFSKDQGFEPTLSRNVTTTDHDGIFLLKSTEVEAYIGNFHPLLLRRTSGSGKQFAHLNPTNIGISKGLERDHVLIIPTAEIKRMLQDGTPLEGQRAAYLYVAVTRAKQSVAFVLDDPGNCLYPYWDGQAQTLPS